MKQSYAESLASIGSLSDALTESEPDTHTEYAVLDRAGRVQIPKELLESIGVKGNKIRIEVVDGKIVIAAPDEEV